MVDKTTVFLKYKRLLFTLIGFSIISGCIQSERGKEHPDFFDNIIIKAKNLTDSGYPTEAFAYLDSCYAQFPNPSKFDLYRKYKIKGEYYAVIQKDYQKATIYIDSMLLMLSHFPEEHIHDYSSTLIIRGYVLFNSNNFIEAYKAYYEGKQFAVKHSDSCSFAALSNGLGLVLFAQQKYLEAKDYFSSASKEAKYCEHKDFVRSFELRQGYMNNIALCYERANMTDSAIIYYQRVLDFINSSESLNSHEHRSKKIAIAVVNGNLGSSYMKLGDYSRAEQLLKSSIATNYKKGYDKRDAQFSMIKLAQLYLETGQYEKAKEYINIARAALDSLAYDKAELRWKKLSWQYYEKLKNIDSAYKHYQAYIDYKDSFDSARKDLEGTDFSETFESLSQRYEIDILKKDNRLKNLYLISALIVGLMTLLVIYFILKNNRTTKKNLKELTELNEEITSLNLFKDKVLAILAHDIRGPLASLTGVVSVEDDHASPELIKAAKLKLKKQLLVVNDLLDNMLHWASFSFKKGEEHTKEIISIKNCIQKNIDILKSIADEKSILILNNITEDIYTEANHEQLKIIFRNILANAIKFTPADGNIIIDAERKEEDIYINITDNGVGMNKEQIEKLFGNTYNSSYGTQGEKGIGLGLLITKEYLEKNEGSIRVQSIEGKGTKVIVRLKEKQ